MKKLILFAVTALTISSCTETLNDKAETLIEKDMENTLVNPKTYDALETETDSAFAPYDDPELFTLVLDIARENIAISQIEQKVEELKANMANAEKGMNMTTIKKSEEYKANYERLKLYYDECKNQIDEIEPKKDDVAERIKDKLEVIKERLAAKREFIGYKSVHRYSAENQNGEELTDSCYYLFDKDMKEVILSLPLNQYNFMQQSFETMKKELSSIENDSIK